MIDVSITQNTRTVSAAQVDKLDSWLVITAQGMRGDAWRQIPYGKLIRSRRRQRVGSSVSPEAFVTDLPNTRGTRVVHVELPAMVSAFKRLRAARKAVDKALETHPREVPVSCYGFSETSGEAAVEALVSAILASACHLPSLKRDGPKSSLVEKIRLLGTAFTHRFERAQAEAAGNSLARYLSVMPSNELTPARYRERVEHLAADYGWSCEFIDVAALKRRRAGAFLAVVQGSPTDDAGILHLSYRPERKRQRRPVALVGKGICFDTGGVNVKPQKSMLGMHGDMQGSAVALGTLLALTRLEVDFPVDCWMALAMNHIGPKAYKPNDVVRALDGTTIEIIHTDAEGRMVLADTLTMASNKKPALIIDYATLTGACVYSLGRAYSGVFTNRDDFHGTLIEAGRASGERVWPFPQDDDYDHDLQSTIADVKQCAEDGQADHILAARFLSRFVKHEVPWIHVDLAARKRKGGLAHIPTETTGFGVRFSCNLLLDQDVLET